MGKVKEMNEVEYAAGKIVMIPIEKLAPHLENVRKNVGDVSELAESIKKNGVLQNLTVVKFADCVNEGDEEYYVVIGNRRLAAAKEAGLTELPCVIADMTREEQIKTMLLENIQRSDLTPMEQADGFQLLLDFGETLTSIAADTGFSESTVRRRIRLSEVRKAVGKGFEGRQISFEDLDKLYKIEDEKRRAEVAQKLGTNDFDWSLKYALEEEKKDKGRAWWRGFIEEKGIREVPAGSSCFDYVACLSVLDRADKFEHSFREIPTEELYYAHFSVTASYVYFYRKRTAETSGAPELSEKEKAEREKREARAHKESLLREAEKRAFELRRDFVHGVGETTARKALSDIVSLIAAHAVWMTDYDLNEDLFFYVIGRDRPVVDDGIYNGEKDIEAARSFAGAWPCKALLATVYAKVDGESVGVSDWHGHFIDDDENCSRVEFEALLEMLAALGYEESDEEIALRDGTSELYLKEGEE